MKSVFLDSFLLPFCGFINHGSLGVEQSCARKAVVMKAERERLEGKPDENANRLKESESVAGSTEMGFDSNFL